MIPVALLLGLYFTSNEIPEPVAMVLSVEGENKLRRLDPVRAGEVVSVPARGSLRLIFLADGHTETIPAGATVKILESGGTPAEVVKREKTRLPGGQLRGLRSLAVSARSGVSRIRDAHAPPPPLSPVQGATVLGTRPRFVWNAVPGVAEYEIRLFHGGEDRNENLVWSERVRRAGADFPDGRRALERGEKYTWKVLARGGEIVVAGAFTAATKEQAAEFEPVQRLAESEELSDRLLAAMLFEAGRIYEEAHQLLEACVAKLPGEPWVLLARARQLGRLGRTAEAMDLEGKALSLAKRPR
jgi:hypothetical protein